MSKVQVSVVREAILKDEKVYDILKDIPEYQEIISKLNIDKDNLNNDLKYINQYKISKIDLDMIKLCAQLISVNGEEYKFKLIEYIKSNPDKYNSIQFEFLTNGGNKKGQKNEFQEIFEYYIRIYDQVLKYNNETSQGFKRMKYSDHLDINYEISQEEYKLRQVLSKHYNKQIEIERNYAMIDWNQFKIVETIEFSDLDKVSALEMPLRINELEMRSILEKRKGLLIEDNDETTEGTHSTNNDNNNSNGVNSKFIRKGIKVKSNYKKV